ncbi:MAG: glycosyltransferase family 4 protein [Nitrospinales bacterium]
MDALVPIDFPGINVKILFLTDTFPPERTAPAARVYEHVRYWVRWGHQVTILTCAPNFPEGKVFPGYRNEWRQAEMMDGIRVIRVKTFIAANEGFILRTLAYLSYMISAFLFGLFQKKPDVIIATSPQLFSAVGGWLLAAVRRKPFIFELRDIWPESIVAVGALHRGLLFNCLEWLELFLYRRSDAIVSVTQSLKKNLVDRGISAEKISVILNGVENNIYNPRPKDPELEKELRLSGKFVVGFIGTHGMAHGLDSVLNTAALCREKKNIHFLFVGTGAFRKKLITQAKNLALSNVTFVGSKPKGQMPFYWSLCDVALVHLMNKPLFKTAIPSKIFEAMAMGLPILIAVPEGEATRIIQDTGSGRVVLPENPEGLMEVIVQMYESPEQLKIMAQKSHEASFRFSREVQARNMINIIQNVGDISFISQARKQMTF